MQRGQKVLLESLLSLFPRLIGKLQMILEQNALRGILNVLVRFSACSFRWTPWDQFDPSNSQPLDSQIVGNTPGCYRNFASDFGTNHFGIRIYSKFTLDSMIKIDSMTIELLANGAPLLRVVKAVKKRLNLREDSNSIILRWSSEDCKRTADR